MKPNQIKGAAFVFISAFMYATLPILTKTAYSHGLTPVSAMSLRYLLAFILLSIYLGAVGKDRLYHLSRLTILQSLVLISGGLCFFYSLQTLSAGLAIVVFFCHPVLVALLAAIVFREKLSWRLISALFFAVGGIFLLSGLLQGSIQMSPTGLAFIISSAVLYSIYSLISQTSVSRVSPLTLTNTMALIAIIVLAVVFHDTGFILKLTPVQMAIGLGLALLNTVLSVFYFLKGVQLIGATKATLVGTLEPVLTMLLAFALLQERFSSLEIIGAILVFTSMFLAMMPSVSGTQREEIQL